MDAREKISAADIESLQVIHYPDPRLMENCSPIETVDDEIRALAGRMRDLMFEAKGVGLAAPQVGVTVRMFLASPEFRPDETFVYINPEIVRTEGAMDGEEGCLSFPGIFCKVKRSAIITVRALGLDGEPFEQTLTELHSRIVQHENDHLDGRLLVHRMGSVAKLANRKALRSLEEEFAG
jgi:peptide deformylase